MGQRSSKVSSPVVEQTHNAATVRQGESSSRRSTFTGIGAISRKLRSASTRHTPRWRSAFLRSFFRNKQSNNETTLHVSETITAVASTDSPTTNTLSIPEVMRSPTEVNRAPQESLTIMEGAISTSNAFPRRESTSQRSTASADASSSQSIPGASSPSSSETNSEGNGGASEIDERLQSSIDILAALLSMATAATATSLLTGTTDVLSTLASDSPSGPQVSPMRARAAWDILQNLFYLRLNRTSTMAPHIELFRDLALAVLTARTITTPMTVRGDRPELPAGSFERFLVELNASVRTSLREDYTRRGNSPAQESVNQPRRLNWWRAYQFPTVPTEQASPNPGSPIMSTPFSRSSVPLSETSPSAPAPGSQPEDSTNSQRNHNHLVPVVLVGLRALSRERDRTTMGAAVPAESQTSGTDAYPNVTPGSDPLDANTNLHERRNSMDNVDAITSSYVIIVLGGHYPPEHRYASTINTEDVNELDQLWDLVDLVPSGPKTTTTEELSKSGLTCFKASKISEMGIAENTVEKCLICLEEYAPDNELRLLKCTHAFHRDCIDRWLTEGQNGCPLCRAQGVPR